MGCYAMSFRRRWRHYFSTTELLDLVRLLDITPEALAAEINRQLERV